MHHEKTKNSEKFINKIIIKTKNKFFIFSITTVIEIYTISFYLK